MNFWPILGLPILVYSQRLLLGQEQKFHKLLYFLPYVWLGFNQMSKFLLCSAQYVKSPIPFYFAPLWINMGNKEFLHSAFHYIYYRKTVNQMSKFCLTSNITFLPMLSNKLLSMAYKASKKLNNYILYCFCSLHQPIFI